METLFVMLCVFLPVSVVGDMLPESWYTPWVEALHCAALAATILLVATFTVVLVVTPYG